MKLPGNATMKGRYMPERSGPLLRGLAAYGGAEALNRLVRICATMVIARQLAPHIIGEAALALTIFELVRVLARTGVGQKIISCPAAELDATCNTAHRLFWQWGFVLAILQWLIAAIVAAAFGQYAAGGMLAMLSLVYLVMPGGLVQCHLAMREGLANRTAKTTAAQAMADHVLTAVLLIAWPSPWSVALPKLLTAPVWLVMTRRARPWRADALAGTVPMRSIAGFSASVLAAEIMTALRTQGDNLIVAMVMGTGALGTYYFAYNAGIGIVSSLVNAFGLVAFPLLCATAPGEDRRTALRGICLVGLAVFIPLIALQSLAASWYVPLLFGAHWAFAAPLVSLMCLGGLPLLAATLNACWLRAQGRPGADAISSAFTCITALGGLVLGIAMGSLGWAAAGLIAGQTIAAAFYAARILGPALRAPAPAVSLPENMLKEQIA